VPNANPAFEQELGRPVTLADVVEKVYAFSEDGSFIMLKFECSLKIILPLLNSIQW
jgi:hypothetical protein